MTETVDDLKQRISRCSEIINGLKDYEPFKKLLADMQASIQYADASWHLLKYENRDEYYRLRSDKLAALKIITILDDYKHDMDMATQRLAEMEHPELVQGGYYDND